MSIIDEIVEYSGITRITGDDKWEKEYIFPADFIGFAGHFPGNPILPAIVQICMIRLLLNEVVGYADFIAIKSAKIRKPIRPHERIVLKMDKSKAFFFVDDANVAEFRIIPCLFASA